MPFCSCLGIVKELMLIGSVRLLPRNERSALHSKSDMISAGRRALAYWNTEGATKWKARGSRRGCRKSGQGIFDRIRCRINVTPLALLPAVSAISAWALLTVIFRPELPDPLSTTSSPGSTPSTSTSECTTFPLRRVRLTYPVYRPPLTFHAEAPKAIKEIVKFAQKSMGVNDVRVSPGLNQAVWARGVRSPPRRIRVRLERKRNDDEGAKEKLYVVASVVEGVTSFKVSCVAAWLPVGTDEALQGLQTVVVENDE